MLEKTGSRTVSNVIEGGAIEALERRIDQLRGALRRAAGTGDRARARALRAELRQAEHAWDDAVTDLEHRATEHRATELPSHRASKPFVFC